MVTGLDLVEQMIRVAAGETLAFTQDDVKLNGWSIENRVYAEDPYRGFLPSTGRLVRYRPSPAELSHQPFASSEVEKRATSAAAALTRVDDGVFEGGEVSMFYDPMIAKLITWAPTREQAIDRQITALDSFVIDGIGHNVDFLSALMQHERFRSGAITTGFIAEEYPEGFHGAPAEKRLTCRLAALAGALSTEAAERALGIDGQLGPGLSAPTEWVVRIGPLDYPVSVASASVSTGDGEMAVDIGWRPGEPVVEAEIEGEHLTVKVEKTRMGWRFNTRGGRYDVRVLTPAIARLAEHMIEKVPPDLSKYLLCPMPGLLTALHVREGERVEAGQPLAVVEAMKMENILRAEKAGTVASVNAKPGDSLAVDAVILEFD
jgi:propionyl-CoA carboxylase alpha chain